MTHTIEQEVYMYSFEGKMIYQRGEEKFVLWEIAIENKDKNEE